MKKAINRGERRKTLSEVKSFENISKNLQFSRDNLDAKVLSLHFFCSF